jgi:glyoxylase-like metal-dependent hydrolase (beta-lactamase superfamily II)
MLSLESRERLERAGLRVLERGWLSSNNVLIVGNRGPSALVDSGYGSHAPQTLDLVRASLLERPLDLLLNTHLHSDHCGGNALLQHSYPALRTLIPPGQADAVSVWDEVALSYAPTGQQCPRFRFDGLLRPGDCVLLGDWNWEVHGAKGHDPHSIILHQRENGLLLSADALWQNGFGVVFPELEGESAFAEVRETLELIQSLSPAVVVPGHGPAFDEVNTALERSHARLRRFEEFPEQHLRHAHKVLIKFRLLEWQQIAFDDLLHWVEQTPYLRQAAHSPAYETSEEWLNQLVSELERIHALKREGHMISNL